jgi:hypothetical protein
MISQDSAITESIRSSEKTRIPAEGRLETDELVLARITEGIYRQPASALRELVSNAYDADATEVIILTDAPRFGQITVRDNGRGLTPEVVTHLIKHIGGSAKRSEEGKDLGVTSPNNINKSPGGRQLIGKLGIGLFSVAQFTRHFLLITKTKGDSFRTIADITLRKADGSQAILPLDVSEDKMFETGHYRIWREPASDLNSQGTEIKLLDLLPRTRAELASTDLWLKQDYQQEDPETDKTKPPVIHIGRIDGNSDRLAIDPALPWSEQDEPRERFARLVQKLRALLVSDRDSVDLRQICDNYIWTLWTLSLSAPIKYLEGHPFDSPNDGEFLFYTIENQLKGKAKKLPLSKGQTPREYLDLKSSDGPTAGRFEVFMDGVQLFRPILFRDLPRTKSAVKTSLLFLGHHRETFGNKPRELTDGPLAFEAYLFWAPKIVPKQHQGVILRVGNASGALFDPEFLGYETSELTRKSQVTAEIFVSEGLDGAINLDRESFNYAHPHYQFLSKWLHSAFRQFSTRHKEIGKAQNTARLQSEGSYAQEKVAIRVKQALKDRGIVDMPEVKFIDAMKTSDEAKLRRDGVVILHRDTVIPPSPLLRHTAKGEERQKLAEKKAVAITQLLHGMGLLDSLSYIEQEQLIRDILEIVLLEN